MPECSLHPGVETNVACAECGRYICPKDMVPTPVGYKCKVCATPAKGQLAFVKPRQLAVASLASLAAAIAGGLLLGQIGIGFFFVALIYGALVAEVARRASGGHRGRPIAIVAGAAAAVGAFAAGFDTTFIALAIGAAFVYAYQNSF